MNNWLKLVLIAYLVGAFINYANTYRMLSRATPELVDQMVNRDETFKEPLKIYDWAQVIIQVLSLVGAVFWPIDLVYRTVTGRND